MLSHKYLFMLSRSTGAKAAWRKLMKLTHEGSSGSYQEGLNFINILWAPLVYKTMKASMSRFCQHIYEQLLCAQIPKVQKRQSIQQCFLTLLVSSLVKGACKMLVKSTPKCYVVDHVKKEVMRLTYDDGQNGYVFCSGFNPFQTSRANTIKHIFSLFKAFLIVHDFSIKTK